MRRALTIFGLVFLFCSCEKAFIADEPGNTYLENFEVFWSEFDRNYSFFEIKKVNWDSVYHVYYPQVIAMQNEQAFFFLLAEIALGLEDGHVNLIGPYGRSSYNFSTGAPDNGPYHIRNYIFDQKTVGNTLEYANISQHHIGYLRIKSFGNDIDDYLAIDDILESFQYKDGLIVDVRSNGGGTTTNSQLIASRFADKERLYLKVKYKNGPGHGDFTEWSERTVKPEGRVHYLKPVVVLTNRSTFSAAEDFVLAMRQFPHVKIVGDTTGGGSGNPIYRELPNGWIFRLSSWIAAGPDEIPFEGIGLYPDVPEWTTASDSTKGADRILMKGLEEVEKAFDW